MKFATEIDSHHRFNTEENPYEDSSDSSDNENIINDDAFSNPQKDEDYDP